MQLDTLKKTTHFLETLKNTVPDAILILTETGIITEINETMKQNYGYEFQELNGKYIHYISHDPSSKDSINFNILEALNKNDKSFQWKLKVKTVL